MFGSRMKKQNRSSQYRVAPRLESLEFRDVPTVIAVPDTYTVAAGQTLTVSVAKGVLANDFSSTNPGAIIVADLKVGPTLTTPPVGPALPANTLTLSANGSFTFIAPSNINPANSPITFTYQARDTTNGEVATTTVTVNITGNVSHLYAVGSGQGQPGEVKVFDASSGLQKFDLFPYESTFTGGVRVTTGDVNADGVDDIVTVPDTGGSALVRVFDGKTGVQLGGFFAFENTFRGGGYVAVGDVAGTGTNQIIVGAGIGGGPRIQVYGLGGTPTSPTFNLPPVADFFAYESTFRNGVSVAAGDLTGTGVDQIVTGAGPGGGPAVKVFGAAQIFSGLPETPAAAAFFAFDSNLRGGVNVAVGQFRGDGKGDIIAGTGNGTATVRVFDGRTDALLRQLAVPSANTPAGGSGTSGSTAGTGGNLLPGVGLPNGLSPGASVGSVLLSGGARVAVTDRNGDGISDIIVGQGAGNQPRVQIFSGIDFNVFNNDLTFGSLFTGGVYVGGNSL